MAACTVDVYRRVLGRTFERNDLLGRVHDGRIGRDWMIDMSAELLAANSGCLKLTGSSQYIVCVR